MAFYRDNAAGADGRGRRRSIARVASISEFAALDYAEILLLLGLLLALLQAG